MVEKEKKDKPNKSDEVRMVEAVSDGLWVLVPIMALMIPILGISDGMDGGRAIPVAIAVCVVMAVGAVLTRMLMAQRHAMRMTELRAEQDIAEVEARQLTEANQVIENNRTMQELRQAVREAETPAPAERITDKQN